ncbi:MAG: hybrid sensor histidine kinase/response regulator [Nitrospirae bacterium]|nr:hybrid sensor histidine kinase/response regulator [Nitrospirota bacterium]
MYKLDDTVFNDNAGGTKSVLVVDDDEAIRLLIRNILEPDYIVVEAVDAAHALEYINDSDFDVILIDHHLGGRDGLDLLIELREDRKVDSVIIFMTSDTSRDLTAQAFRENADDFIGKPINRRLFKYAVQDALLKKDLERQLREAISNAKIEESKTLLIAMASHELHTPLIPMIGLSSALYKRNEDGTLSKDALSDGLLRIAEAARDLNDMIGDILEVASMNKNDILMRMEHTDIRALIERLQRDYRNVALDKGLYLFVTMPEGPQTLFIDGKRLQQVLRLIIDNAIKFTEFGDVEIGLKLEAEDVVLFVRDTGAGIAAEFQERLFKVFEKIDMKSGRSPGLGVGLYLCRRIVEMLGGTIEAESIPGRGSTFSIRLPKTPEYNAES